MQNVQNKTKEEIMEIMAQKKKNIKFVCKELCNVETNPSNYPYDDFMFVSKGLCDNNTPMDVTHTAIDTMYYFKIQDFTEFSRTFLLFLRFVKEQRDSDEGITTKQDEFYKEVFTIFANAGKLIPK